MSSGNFVFTCAKHEARFLKRTMKAVIELKCSYRIELISLKYECFRLCPCPLYWQRSVSHISAAVSRSLMRSAGSDVTWTMMTSFAFALLVRHTLSNSVEAFSVH